MRRRRWYLRGVALAGGAIIAGCTGSDRESQTSGNESSGEQRESHVPEPEPIAQTDEPDDIVAAAQSTSTALGMRIDDITGCGLTCRTFHLTIQNRGERRSGLRVEITGYTPEIGATEVYSGGLDVGAIPAAHERSGIRHDIDVGVSDGQRIERNDGNVALRFEIVSAGETIETFTFDVQLDG